MIRPWRPKNVNLELGPVVPWPGGRLTTESGVTVSTADRTSQGTLYYTPATHDFIRLFNGTRVRNYGFKEFSLSLTITSGKNYDVFVFPNGDQPALELSAAWSSDTSRGFTIPWEPGLGYTKNGDPTRLWVGTVRASGSNVVEDSAAKRFVWNAYNPKRRKLKGTTGTDSWSNASSSYQPWPNNTTSAQVAFVRGFDEDQVYLKMLGLANVSAGAKAVVGIGLDSTTGNNADLMGEAFFSLSGNSANQEVTAVYDGFPGVGYHFLQPVEAALAGTVVFIGDDGNAAIQAGCLGFVMG